MRQIPVIFLPGLTADGRLWQPVVDKLADVVEPIFATFEGDSIAAWVDHVLAGAPDRFYVAGTSAGGYVALDIALRGDGRLAGLILLNTNARGASEAQRQRGDDLIRQANSGEFDKIAEKLGDFVAGGKAELARLASEMTRDAGAESFVRQQKAVLARQDRRDELSRIDVPTLVIAGDEDRLAPPSLNNEIARSIPAAELEIFSCGHLSTLEATDAVANAIRGWLHDRDGA